MAGILSAGVHIPRYRLARADIAGVWGGRSLAGERAVANWDEDALTMAVEAAEHCLAGMDRSSIDLVLVASTTLPYSEKQSAAVVAEALDLGPGVETVDITSSLRAGAQALRIGLRALATGARRVLVVASDKRGTQAGAPMEPLLGDGAVALLLAPEAPVTVRPLYHEYMTAMDTWRLAGEPHIRQGDERFASKVLFEKTVKSAISGALAAAGLRPDQVAKVAVSAVDHRSAVAAVTGSGFPASAVVGEPVYTRVGHCGTAAGHMNLVAALEQLKAGEQVLLVTYGDGADVFLCTAEASEPVGRPLSPQVQNGRPVSYGQVLRFKQLVAQDPVEPYTSEICLWRDNQHLVRLRAPRCNRCGSVQYPPRRVCWNCRAKDDFTLVQLSRKGHLYTYTVEHLFPIPDRQLVTGVVDLADGARIYTQVTDISEDELAVGKEVRLTFRFLHRGGGFNHYFWKAAPLRD